MEVTVRAIIEVLDGVEENLKAALHESLVSLDSHRLDNTPHIEAALGKTQEAITELLLVR